MTYPTVPNSAGPTLDVTVLGLPVVISYQYAGTFTELISTACLLVGWSVRNTDAAAGIKWGLYDGSDDIRAVLVDEYLDVNASSTHWLGPVGIPVRSRLALSDPTNNVEGAVWVIPVPGGL